MSWSNIIGQSRVKSILQRAISEGRIAHAYCFWGAQGVGKDAMAFEFAKIMNCSSPIRLETVLEACDECRSCRQANKLEHPNIRFVFALPTGKTATSDREESPLARLSDDQIKIIREQTELKAADPYHDITIPNASQIKITSIREIKKTAAMSAHQSGSRCIIISEADQMNDEAANAFLKTLEEPHEKVVMILTTSRREQLPQTILSRCQQVFFSLIPDADIMGALVKRKSMDAEDARLVALFAQGSYSRACEFLSEDMRRYRRDIIDALRAALKKSDFRTAMLSHAEVFAAEKDRRRSEIMLGLLMLWLRDAYAFLNTGDASVITNIDQRESIEKFATAFAGAPFALIFQAIDDAVEAIRRNADQRLTLLALLLRCRYALMGRNQ